MPAKTGNEIAHVYVSVIPETSKIAPGIKSAFKGVDATAEKTGRSMGSRLTKAVGKTFKAGAIGIGATAGAAIGTSLAKGLSRLTAIEDAQAKLRGLGNSAEDVSQIMDNALASVKGTSFGLGEAATTAAGAVAAGIAPGRELETVLKAVANTAAASGTSMEEMGAIYNKVASFGKAQNDVLQQVASRGIPIYEALAKQMNVTSEEVFKLASDGSINFETFQKAMTEAGGTVAKELGETTSGALDNAGAAMGRFGEQLAAPIFSSAPALIGGVTEVFNELTDAISPASERIGEVLSPALDSVAQKLETNLAPAVARGAEKFGELAVAFTEAAVDPHLWERIGSTFSSIGKVVSDLWPTVESLAGSFVRVVSSFSLATWQTFGAVIGALAPVLEHTLVPVLNTIADVAESHPGIVNAMVGAWLGMKGINAVTGPVTKAGSAIKETASKAMDFGSAVKTSFEYASQAAPTASKLGQAFTVVKANASSAWETLAKSNPTFAGLDKAAGLAKTALTGLWTVVKMHPMGAIIAAAAAAVAGLTWFFTKTETGQKIFQAAMDGVKAAWDTVVGALQAGWEWLSNSSFGEGMAAAWDALKEKWDEFVTGFGQFYDTWVQPLVDFAALIGEAFGTAFSWLSEKLGEFVEWIGEKFSQLAEFLQPFIDRVTDVFQRIGDVIKAVWEGGVKSVFDAWKAAGDLLGIAMQTAGNIIKAAFRAVGQVISSVWNNIIKPPLTFFRQLGGLLADVLTGNFSNIRNRFRDMGAALKATVMGPINVAFDLFKIAADFAKNAFNAFRDGVGQAVNRIKGYISDLASNFRELPSKIKAAFAGAGTWLLDAGKAIIRGLADGVRAAGGLVADAIRAVVPDNLARFVPGLEFGGIVPAFARGGMLPTAGPGTDTVDGILGISDKGIPIARVNAGEFIINAESTKRHKHLLAAINADRTGTRFKPGFGDLPAYAKGGKVSSKEVLDFARGRRARGVQAPRSLEGAAYVWGGGLLGNWGDCSGAASGIAAFTAGSSVAGRKFATMNEGPVLSQMGFRRGRSGGKDSVEIGYFNGGPYGGHTSSTVYDSQGRGTNLEMGGGRGNGQIGGRAAGARHSQYTDIYHHPLKSTVAATAAKIGAEGAKVESTSTKGVELNTGRTIDWKTANDLYSELEKTRDRQRALASFYGGIYDTGGILPHGRAAVNLSGKPEIVINDRQLSAFSRLSDALMELVPPLKTLAVEQPKVWNKISGFLDYGTPEDAITLAKMFKMDRTVELFEPGVKAFTEMEDAWVKQVHAAEAVKQAEANLADARADVEKAKGGTEEDRKKAAEEVKKAEMDLADARSVVVLAAKAAGFAEIQMALAVVDIVGKVITKIADGLRRAREGMAASRAESMKAVAEWTKLVDDQRETVSKLKMSMVDAQIALTSAAWKTRLSVADVTRAQLEGAKSVAEAEAKLKEEREKVARAGMLHYNDMHAAYDRYRLAEREAMAGRLEDFIRITPEIRALEHEVNVARIEGTHAQHSAVLASLEAMHAQQLAALDLASTTLQLQQQTAQLAQMSQTHFGLNSAQALAGATTAELEAEAIRLRGKTNRGIGWISDFFSDPFGTLKYAIAGKSADQARLKQLENQIAERRAQGLGDGVTLDPRIQRQAEALFGLGLEEEARNLLQSSSWGDAQRALDAAKEQQQLLALQQQEEALKASAERLEALITFETKANPLRQQIDALESAANAEKYRAEYWREESPAVRDALKALADFEATNATDLIAASRGEKTVLNFTLPEQDVYTREQMDAVLALLHEVPDLEARVHRIESPPTGANALMNTRLGR